MTGVRFREDVGWEMRCEACAVGHLARYWPLDSEFWNPGKGLSRCRSCWNAYERGRRQRGRQNRVRSQACREYQREWAARKRAQLRADEGREKYERKAA